MKILIQDHQGFKFIKNSLNTILTFAVMLFFVVGCGGGSSSDANKATGNTDTRSAKVIDVTKEAKITGLYVAYFNRAADQEGLKYWTDKADEVAKLGGDVSSVFKKLSAGFATHPTFKSTYDHLSNKEFVAAIYRNSLGRDGDAVGIAYWTDLVDRVMSRSDMVSDFVELSLLTDLTDDKYSNLSDAELAAAQLRQDLISNKVTAALAFTHQLGVLSNVEDMQDPEQDPAYLASIKIISEVTEEPETVSGTVAFLESIKGSDDQIRDILGVGTIVPGFGISIIAKNLDVPITDPLTKLSYEITSKYDIKSFQVKINNVDRTELATLKDKVLVIKPTPTSGLPFDYLITTLILIDERGRIHTETFSYKVDLDVSISAGFSAEPQIGYAPLEITFSPKVNADESIQLYHWDFGDGTKDDSNTSKQNLIGSPVKHKYKEAGEYTVVLTIYDSIYQPATSQLVVKIYNQPPVVTSIDVSPSNGDFPLKSSFSASATDSEGIREFLWDFNNDGQVDFNDSKINVENPDYIATYASSYTSYTYEEEGKYQALLRVVDINGAITEVSTPTISVLVGPEGTPTVTVRAYPTSGEAPLLVSFSAYGSFSKWEWDFNGDGVFDHSSTTTGNVDHNYTVAGNYFAKLQVTDSNGLKSSDSIEITMGQNISLIRDTDTIDIKNDQSVGLDVTVAGETDTKLLMEDNKYQAIKTLLDWKRRSGTFSTTWDGTDSEGSIVPEGDYYIVLLYKEAGEIKRFDLRTERVNVYKPIATNVKAGDVFAPYLEPMMIEFNLTEASEVSLDIGPDGTSVTERIKTLLLKEPLGKGLHTIVWAGDANDGTLADLSLYKEKYPSDADFYMTGGFMSKLADNAVFVKSGVSVLNLKSDAPVYVPNAIGEDEKRKSLAISFDLTAAASVTLTINDAKTGATVMSKHVASLTKGSQVIMWDGKDAEGKYIAPGVYRIGVKATDSYGHTSLTQYALQRIFY